MRSGFKYLLILALIALTFSAVGWKSVATQSPTILTPTGSLAAKDSVNIGTIDINFDGFDAAKFEITADRSGSGSVNVTRMDYALYASDDDGSTWTLLTEHLDSLFAVVTIGTAGTMRCGADSMATIFLARPGVISFADTLAQAATLFFATDLRVSWTKNVGIGATAFPIMTVDYSLYKGNSGN